MTRRHGIVLALVAAVSNANCGGRNPVGDGRTASDSSANAGEGKAGPDAGPSGNDAGGIIDAGAGGAGQDGGTEADGGVLAEDDCEPLRPASPGAAEHSYSIGVMTSTGQGNACFAGLVDGTGTLALPREAGSSFATSISFVSASGVLLKTADTYRVNTFTAQLDGFEAGVQAWGSGSLHAWDSMGNEIHRIFSADLMAEDPLGGIVGSTAAGRIVSYDERLTPRWTAQVPTSMSLFVVAGVDRRGHTLILFDGSDRYGANSVAGEWIDHFGNAGPVFQFLGPQPDQGQRMGFGLTPRVGNGLFLFQQIRENDRVGVRWGVRWIAQIDSLATSASPAPTWLQARLNTQLHMARGGRAYAVLPLARDSTDCTQTIEVVAPAGTSCGTAVFRAGAGAGACSMKEISIGYDGTVVQQLPDSLERRCWFGPCTCSWQWWSGFLR
jgi:hypothetical protein